MQAGEGGNVLNVIQAEVKELYCKSAVRVFKGIDIAYAVFAEIHGFKPCHALYRTEIGDSGCGEVKLLSVASDGMTVKIYAVNKLGMLDIARIYPLLQLPDGLAAQFGII